MSDAQTCQRCRQPLLLDPSIANLSQAQYDLISSALPTADSSSSSSSLTTAQKLAALPSSSLEAQKAWSANPAESFILLSESQIHPPPQPIPTEEQQQQSPLTLTLQLHQLLSSRTPLSHPLCMDCTTLLQSLLQKQLEQVQKERDAYIAFEREVAQTSQGSPEELAALEEELKELEKQEDQCRAVLKEREVELLKVQADEQAVMDEDQEIERQENDFLLQHNLKTSELSTLRANLSTQETHLLLSTALLARLEATNVYNDAFQIGHVPLAGTSQSVGTINGLRLGGRPAVDWAEINAAWGLVALCIDRVAVKVGCTFHSWKIVPLGSFSRIDELSPGKNSYELYASSELTPARLLQNRRFNYGLVALLECLKQLVEFGSQGDRGWAGGGIEINKDRIADNSIRLGFGMGMGMSMGMMGSGGQSGDEQWTRACRSVLAVLKRILVVESEQDRS